MDPFLLAHAGHWVISLLYVVPVVMVVVFLAIQTRRERARGSAADDEQVD